MRVIVDTSVWSLALRRKTPVYSPETQALTDLIADGRAVMLGAVRQEILSGIRLREHFEKLQVALDAFPDEPLETADYLQAASVCNFCLDAGIITGNTDCLIAAVALRRGMAVLSTDKDFQQISSVLPLMLHSTR